MLTGAQIRMARGFAKWSVQELSARSGVSSATIKRMEDGDGVPSSLGDNLAKIQRALEAAGVEFIPENGGGAGVRLATPRLSVNGQLITPVAFGVGDQVQFIVGREDKPELRGKAGVVIEVEPYPIEMGPAARIRVQFGEYETAWHQPGVFRPA